MADGNHCASPPADHAAAAKLFDGAIVATARDAILVASDSGAVVAFNPAAERLFGYEPGEVLGAPVGRLLPAAALADLAVASAPAEGRRKDGAVLTLAVSASQWRADGRSYIALTLRDVSDQLRGEELQELRLGELNHRVKNSLAAVQAIICHTLRDATDLESAKQVLVGRMMALARGHEILTREDWEGARLRTVIEETIEAHGLPERFAVAGPDACLTPKVALALSMALYELGANAAKYGALATADGRVEIEVTHDACQLRLVWRERGGPAVAAPTRRGFGSRMIATAAHDLRGTADLDFRPEGLVCTLTAPR